MTPWHRDASGPLNLCTEISGGAAPAHLVEVATWLNIQAKLTCRPNLVSLQMEQNKWSSVRSV